MNPDPQFHPMYQPPANASSTVVVVAAKAEPVKPPPRPKQKKPQGVLYVSRQPVWRPRPLIGRNKPCRCGSGKKRKKCHPDL